jgi:cbb3-type cytochrome oxidase maturation protein
VSVLIVLVIISIIVALFFLGAFIWSVKNGQYDDSYTPSVRILLDEESHINFNKDKITAENHRDKKRTAEPSLRSSA